MLPLSLSTAPLSSGLSSAAAALQDALRDSRAKPELRLDVPLSGLSRWRIGGPADVVVSPATRDELAVTLQTVKALGLPNIVIGDGSNLLFDDEGFRGVVIRIGRAFTGIEIAPDGCVEAGAGLWVPSFVRRVISAGLGGIVHAVGIPGTLGGLCVMNGGSQRKGIGEHVVAVEAMDRDGRIHRLSHAELGFAYRESSLQTGDLVVTGATLQLEPGDAPALRREAIEILASRRAKFPKIRANCGSVFVSDPKLYDLIGPPGLAIEKAGLKGLSSGDAQISPEHANFIVNNGAARSADVLNLIHCARDKVEALSGVAMDAEVRHVSPIGVMRPAHEVRPDTLHMVTGPA